MVGPLETMGRQGLFSYVSRIGQFEILPPPKDVSIFWEPNFQNVFTYQSDQNLFQELFVHRWRSISQKTGKTKIRQKRVVRFPPKPAFIKYCGQSMKWGCCGHRRWTIPKPHLRNWFPGAAASFTPRQVRDEQLGPFPICGSFWLDE